MNKDSLLEITPYEQGTILRHGEAWTPLWNVNEVDAARAIEAAIALAGATFTPRWQALSGPNLSASAFVELLHRIVFERLYACAINGQPPIVTVDDLSHPYAWRQVRSAISRHLQWRDADAAPLAAALLDIPTQRYISWLAQEAQMDAVR